MKDKPTLSTVKGVVEVKCPSCIGTGIDGARFLSPIGIEELAQCAEAEDGELDCLYCNGSGVRYVTLDSPPENLLDVCEVTVPA
jgi:hypothetical protein